MVRDSNVRNYQGLIENLSEYAIFVKEGRVMKFWFMINLSTKIK